MKLNKTKIPEVLWNLIPLAEKFGISDDGYRWDCIQQATDDELAELKQMVNDFDDHFDEWLAGPESSNYPFSEEYIAFTALRMASDEA